MLPADNRMRRPGDFAATVRRGVRRTRGAVTVHVRRTHQDEQVLVGFVVPKTVGNAPERNLVKRRMRAVLREHVPELRGRAVVVRAGVRCAQASFSELRADIEAALAAAGAAVGNDGRSA